MSYQGNYPQQAYYPSFRPSVPGSPATSVVAGVLGLAVAGGLAGSTGEFFGQVLKFISFTDLPAGMQALYAGRLVVAALALVGALLLFTRRMAGAALVAVSAFLGVVAIVVEPFVSEVLSSVQVSLADYFKQMFTFEQTYLTLLAAAGVAGVLAFVFAIVPSTPRWLRGRTAHSIG
ncbi:hypothetical protein [Actinokineospora inagensis]|uniref:hypothetical protein n=1 Tax=Actinokineospora inagensis TaxID=103730 RepID=UPI0003FCABC8|nr:hypothetical protein [Actinokineospora inagensis]